MGESTHRGERSPAGRLTVGPGRWVQSRDRPGEPDGRIAERSAGEGAGARRAAPGPGWTVYWTVTVPLKAVVELVPTWWMTVKWYVPGSSALTRPV